MIVIVLPLAKLYVFFNIFKFMITTTSCHFIVLCLVVATFSK